MLRGATHVVKDECCRAWPTSITAHADQAQAKAPSRNSKMGCCGGKQERPEWKPNPNADPKLATLSKKNFGGGMKSAATPIDLGPDTSDIDTATNRAVKIAKAS